MIGLELNRPVSDRTDYDQKTLKSLRMFNYKGNYIVKSSAKLKASKTEFRFTRHEIQCFSYNQLQLCYSVDSEDISEAIVIKNNVNGSASFVHVHTRLLVAQRCLHQPFSLVIACRSRALQDILEMVQLHFNHFVDSRLVAIILESFT